MNSSHEDNSQGSEIDKDLSLEQEIEIDHTEMDIVKHEYDIKDESVRNMFDNDILLPIQPSQSSFKDIKEKKEMKEKSKKELEEEDREKMQWVSIKQYCSW